MKRPLALIVLAAAAIPPASPAQAPPAKAPTALTLRPAAEPRPALRYRLVAPRPALVPGNAAVFYHRALQMYSDRRTLIDQAPRDGDVKAAARATSIDLKVGTWINGPIAEIPGKEARAALEQFAGALNEVDQGVKRLDCDWEFDHRPEGISLLLPEIQGVRPLARLISLQARLAILDGDLDRAFGRVQAGMTLGRHIARGPIVIQGLVGVAISNEMLACLQALIQAPGAPSLYWALANRPRPFIDLRDAYDAEHDALETELPALRDLESGIWGRDQARRFADALQGKLVNLFSPSMPGSSLLFGNSGMISDRSSTSIRKLGIASACARVYPEARRALLAAGTPEERVDAMPVIQVACLYSYREYQRANDDLQKGLDLPYWQLSALPRAAGFESVEAKLANPIWATFSLLASDLRSVRVAVVRLERIFDALECIEAIRLDASARGGKLPGSLEAIVSNPCPLDPAAGKPFLYEVAGDSATLNGPIPAGAPEHPSYAIRYVLKPAR